MFAGVSSDDKDPRKSRAHRRHRAARARARRGVPRGHGELDQLQHGVDLDLRALAHVPVPVATREGERLGRASRPAVPRDRLRRVGRGPARRIGRASLEAGRRGDGALQLRRRSGPVFARRLDARDEPADLGVRVELRRSGRDRAREGQPADAEAGAPHLGGGGGERPDELHQLPDDRQPQRLADDPGPDGADLGCERGDRRVRGAVRAERRRDPGRRRVVAGACGPGARARVSRP